MPTPRAADRARSPHLVTEFADREAEFLAHACLTYGADSPERRARAADLVPAEPPSLLTAVVLGDVEATRAWLDRDPGAAVRPGGPFDWEPLLYLAYARLDRGNPVVVAGLLLDAGADPDSGFLWQGLTPAFTALTGAFGGGEGDQPRHPHEQPLARLLLRAGADPNDGQALYNRMFTDDDSHLRLLFEFGLGTGDGGPWGGSPARMLHDVLLWAAAHDQRARVELLLDHGVDPDADFPGHPAHAGRGALELAIRSGNTEIADRLRGAGARAVELDDEVLVVAAALRGDADALAAAAPGLLQRARDREPLAVLHAAGRGRVRAVRLLVEAGWDVNASARHTALHQAAVRGDLPLVQALLDLGADPSSVDGEYGATPLGWAEHGGHPEVVELLRGSQA
ncbi:ankyrin repeat domain-containing protein [Actinokineospora sp. NBRC 105648]|uniref:ankyrin repeat domain-containing protein n=1 Tax=Actinokineospora sp. NBRC 105648 TaxID=3032206 RepID=UPI0024A3A4A3|nr:ankyrin repeat domain-containing protein [Actinokineospora sp. NBRC 105648]GLZ41004.1 hypothetical protein Acsp05_46280 [Actinokineospora sp. NBRC 105648]